MKKKSNDSLRHKQEPEQHLESDADLDLATVKVDRAVELYAIVVGLCRDIAIHKKWKLAGCKFLLDNGLAEVGEDRCGNRVIILTERIRRKLAVAKKILKPRRKLFDLN